MESFSNLAWICAAAPDPALRDPDRALKLARRACELSDYKHWMPLCSLAAAHAERGEFEDARARMEEAMTLVPDDLREWLSERAETIKAGKPVADRARIQVNASSEAGDCCRIDYELWGAGLVFRQEEHDAGE